MPIELGPDAIRRCVDEARVAFCFAPKFHPALRFLGPARRELSIPTTFNYLGPLLNPARVTRQVVGVSDSTMAERMLAVLAANGTTDAMVVHGDDGLDELTLTTTSTVHRLRDGQVTVETIEPTSLGLVRCTPDDLAGGDAATNAAAVRAVLDGAPGAAREVAVLNAAAALVVAGLAVDFERGVAHATAALDDGRAASALARWIDVANEVAD